MSAVAVRHTNATSGGVLAMTQLDYVALYWGESGWKLTRKLMPEELADSRQGLLEG
ncbi:hypothetical protein [Streptomyces sp. NBC_01618]|uniref:hypothetical protein n=1 Tax=Streptomyces sp. NBC_01618 TaxID=2975900 RepID=UPI003866DC68|nr:hypothetical protein OH735_34755 [Streptomyces sp. NBC_01618]